MYYNAYETEEYSEWLSTQSLKSRMQIHDRISKIEDEGYFGNHKYLADEDIWELKFNDGRRIYYVVIEDMDVILLLGGNKNGQTKDIKKASSILRKISDG